MGKFQPPDGLALFLLLPATFAAELPTVWVLSTGGTLGSLLGTLAEMGQAINLVRSEEIENVRVRAAELAEDRLVRLLAAKDAPPPPPAAPQKARRRIS